MRELPDYLRPLPGSGDGSGASAAQAAAPGAEEAGGTPGLIAPRSRGHTGGFLTDAIAELGYATPEQVEQAIATSRTAGRRPEEVLLEQGAINSEQLSRATAERYGLDYVDLSLFSVDMGAANLVSAKSARQHQALPIAFVDESTLLLAMADPTNLLALDDVQMATGLSCAVAVAPAGDIESLITKISTMQSTISDAITEGEAEAEEATDEAPAEITDLRASAQDGPVMKLVNSILGQAVAEGASDIHFEPEDGDMRIRFRIDGVLQESARVPKRMVAGVVSTNQDHERAGHRREADSAGWPGRESGSTIAGSTCESRLFPPRPAKGRRFGSSTKRTRCGRSTTSAWWGTSGSASRPRSGSPMEPCSSPGPTGAGKSTTLYAALQDLNEVDKHIVTIEDPVEYRLRACNQIGVHRKAGLTFATGLRSVLRADPDVIMVGEIRDSETARIAIEAALTGHMVLTTLHTNDAPGAITRLQEMGIESFLTSSAVECVVAQRLARVLCAHCKRRVGHSAGVAHGVRLPGRHRPRGL